MQILIHNRTNSNLHFKLSSINTESQDVIEIPLNQTKMVLTQTIDNILELWEGEFPFDTRRFYEVKTPSEILVNNADEVFLFDENRNLKKLFYSEEKDYFDSNTIHVVNLSEKTVYARIDKPGKHGNCVADDGDFLQINPGAFSCWKRNSNQFYIMQVGVQKGISNLINYVLKAGYEYSITDDLNVISNLTAKIYYTHRRMNEFVHENDVLSLDINNDLTSINQGTDLGSKSNGNLNHIAVTTQSNDNQEKIMCRVYGDNQLNLLSALQKESLFVHNDSNINLNMRIKSIGVGDEEFKYIGPKNRAQWPREPGFYLAELSFYSFNLKNESENYKSCFYLQENKIYVFTKEFLVIDYETSEIQKPTSDAFNIDTLGYLDCQTYYELNNQNASGKSDVYFYQKDIEINTHLKGYKVQKEKEGIEKSNFNLGFGYSKHDDGNKYCNNMNNDNNYDKNKSAKLQNKRKLSDDLYDVDQINQNSFNLLLKSSNDINQNYNDHDSINNKSQPKILYENVIIENNNKFVDINEIGYENNFDINKIQNQIVYNPNKNSAVWNNNSNSVPFNSSNHKSNPNFKNTSIINFSEKTICIRTQINQISKATDGYQIVALAEYQDIAREVGLYVLEINTVKKQKFYFKIEIGINYKYLEDGHLIDSSTGSPVELIADKDPESLLDRETDVMQIGFIQNFFTNNLYKTVETLLSKKEFCGICLLELDSYTENLEMHFKLKHTVNYGKSILFETPSDDTHLSKGSEHAKFKEIDECLGKMNISQSKVIGEENGKKNILEYARLINEKFDNNNNNQVPKLTDVNNNNHLFNFDGTRNNLFDNPKNNNNIDNLNSKNSKFIVDINDTSIKNESKHYMQDLGSADNSNNNKNSSAHYDKNSGENNNNNSNHNNNGNSKNNVSINILNQSNKQNIINVDVRQSEIDREFNKEKFSLIEKLLLKMDEKIDQIQKKMEDEWEKLEKQKADDQNFNIKFENNFKNLNENLNKAQKDLSKNFCDSNNLLIKLKAEQMVIKNNLHKQSDKMDSLQRNLYTKHEELKKMYQDLNQKSNDNFDDNFHKIEKQLFKVNIRLAEEKKEFVDFSIPEHWVQYQMNNLHLCILDKKSDEYIELNKRFLSTLPNNTIKSITRIQNLSLWKNFCFAKYQLNKKGNSTHKLLFHGTKTTNPEIIYGGTEDGFDLRFCNQGMWGIGCYFHQNSVYSDGYRHTKILSNRKSSNIMLVAEVLVGNTKTLPKDHSLRLPPFIEGSTTERYDSVNSGDGIHIIYNNQRAYPAYIIEYN